MLTRKQTLDLMEEARNCSIPYNEEFRAWAEKKVNETIEENNSISGMVNRYETLKNRKKGIYSSE